MGDMRLWKGEKRKRRLAKNRKPPRILGEA
jgi:hypothetical protein